jgi:hypothetical protein
MQVRRRVAVTMATVALLVTALAAAPVAAETPLAGLSRYWKVDKNSVKGLVTVNTPNGVDLTVAFHLWGLTPDASYILRGSSAPCSSPAGTPEFQRTFKANSKGIYWDPVTVPAAIEDMASVRLFRKRIDKASPVLCINSSSGAAGRPNANIATLKIGGGVRGVAVIDESNTRRTVVSLTGLKAGVQHTLVIGTGGCTGSGGTILHRYRFTPDAKGRALVERFVFEPASVAGLGGGTVAGSIRVKRGSTQLACATPVNAIL